MAVGAHAGPINPRPYQPGVGRLPDGTGARLSNCGRAINPMIDRNGMGASLVDVVPVSTYLVQSLRGIQMPVPAHFGHQVGMEGMGLGV